jgi:hypothetical protein
MDQTQNSRYLISFSYEKKLQDTSIDNVFFGAASNSAYYGYPELWILRYPAHRYHAVPSPGFEVRRRNHSATTLHNVFLSIFFAVLRQERKSDVMTSFGHSARSAIYHKAGSPLTLSRPK